MRLPLWDLWWNPDPLAHPVPGLPPVGGGGALEVVDFFETEDIATQPVACFGRWSLFPRGRQNERSGVGTVVHATTSVWGGGHAMIHLEVSNTAVLRFHHYVTDIACQQMFPPGLGAEFLCWTRPSLHAILQQQTQ